MSKGGERQGDFCNAMLVHEAETALGLILSTFTELKLHKIRSLSG